MKRQNNSIDLSVVIVNFNTRELVLSCIRSLVEGIGRNINWELIVVDNGSDDGSSDEISNFTPQIPHIRIIRNKNNRGFAAANNQGIRVSRGRYVLLLNSDTEITNNSVARLMRYMDQSGDVGAVTPLINLPGGSMDPACHRGFPTPWASLTYFVGLEKVFGKSRLFGQYHQGYKPMGEIHDVDCISGAFFLVRHSVIDSIGALDERFFMYGEDIDWCYRIRQRGYRIVFYPGVSILHKKHQSGLAHRDDRTRMHVKKYFYDSMELFYAKHYQRRYGFFTSVLVRSGIKIRSLL